MNEYQRKLIIDLNLGKISKQEFLSKFGVDFEKNPDYILEVLKSAYSEKNSKNVEYAMLLIGYVDFGPKYTDILNQLLLEEWHNQHEDIAQLLQSLKSPSSVKYLFAATNTHFDYLSYNDCQSLIVKCAFALGDINNEEARKKLKLMAGSENEIISEAGKEQLKRIGVEW